jgi:two-component system, OmpR family, phosphate regulon sensor histidine kinase PhoR
VLKSRFLWQIWGVLGITLIISTVLFGFIVADQVERDALDRVEQSLLEQAHSLIPSMAGYLTKGEVLEPSVLVAATPGIAARITLIDADGLVLADNKRSPLAMDNHGGRPEILASLRSSHGVVTRFSQTLNLSMLYLAVPIKSIPGSEGFLRLAVPVTRIQEQTRALQVRVAASALIAGVLLLMVGYFLAYRVTSPITRMTDIARNIATGEYHLRLPGDRQDELGQLSTVINELAHGAQQKIDELTGSRNRLAAVLAGLTEGVVAFDLNQTVLHVNQSALNMLSLKYEDVVGRKFDETPTLKEIRQVVRTCTNDKTNVVSTVSADTQTLECSCILMDEGGTGEVSGAILVLEDITERSRLEEVRSDFVANASHELKTPISAIRGLVETIIDDPKMPEDVATGFIERIRQQAIRLDHIVQDLLQLSRFDSSEREKNVAGIDLAELLAQVHQAKSMDAVDAGVELELDLSIDALEVEGEAEALNQLVVNLVDNAIKYTGEGGKVKLMLQKIGSMAHIEVQDNGIGISRDECERIFERFYRVDRARSRDLGGTGLGLAIVKHIAQSHLGSVTVDSQLGEGSTFAVRIPLAE